MKSVWGVLRPLLMLLWLIWTFTPGPELSTDYCVSGSLYYYVLIMQNIRLPTKKTLAQVCLFWFVLVFLSKAQNRVVVETCGRVTDT